MKASDFLAARNDLLNTLREIDAEISKVITNKRSSKAFEKAKALFAGRDFVVSQLAEFGLDVEAHPAVLAHINK